MKTRQELKRLYHSSEFQEKYLYEGSDLGAVCTEEGTSFLLWSPLAEDVKLRFYKDGEKASCYQVIPMEKEEKESGRTGQRKIFTEYIMIMRSLWTEKKQLQGILMQKPAE